MPDDHVFGRVGPELVTRRARRVVDFDRGRHLVLAEAPAHHPDAKPGVRLKEVALYL